VFCPGPVQPPVAGVGCHRHGGDGADLLFAVNHFRADDKPFRTEKLFLTLPFAVFGVLRYLYLVEKRDAGGIPRRSSFGAFRP